MNAGGCRNYPRQYRVLDVEISSEKYTKQIICRFK